MFKHSSRFALGVLYSSLALSIFSIPLVAQTAKNAEKPKADAASPGDAKKAPPKATPEQEKEIRDLIEQLVFEDAPAAQSPPLSPGVSDKSDDYSKRFDRCHKAFAKLTEYKQLAFPFLVEHLGDERQSVPFRNHMTGFSVGYACFWNIYFQLQDRPKGYSFYSDAREGRDGLNHDMPYMAGTPFDKMVRMDNGNMVRTVDLKGWFDENKDLNYTEMQIKCLRWLLEKEKAIGASDAESYFVNILPLEIQILERRKENGEDVAKELAHSKEVRDKKLAGEIPPELLPAK